MYLLKNGVLIWFCLQAVTSSVILGTDDLTTNAASKVNLSDGYGFGMNSVATSNYGLSNSGAYACSPWNYADCENTYGSFANQLSNSQSINYRSVTANGISSVDDSTPNSYFDNGLDGSNYNIDPNFDGKDVGKWGSNQYTNSDGNEQTEIIGKHVEITRNDPYPVLKQVHVPVQRPVTVNIPHTVLVPVREPVPVHIPVAKPKSIAVPIEVTIPIEKLIPYAVVKKIPYTVEKYEPYHVEKVIAVQKRFPYPIKVPVVKTIVHRVNRHSQYKEHRELPHYYKKR